MLRLSPPNRQQIPIIPQPTPNNHQSLQPHHKPTTPNSKYYEYIFVLYITSYDLINIAVYKHNTNTIAIFLKCFKNPSPNAMQTPIFPVGTSIDTKQNRTIAAMFHKIYIDHTLMTLTKAQCKARQENCGNRY